MLFSFRVYTSSNTISFKAYKAKSFDSFSYADAILLSIFYCSVLVVVFKKFVGKYSVGTIPWDD